MKAGLMGRKRLRGVNKYLFIQPASVSRRTPLLCCSHRRALQSWSCAQILASRESLTQMLRDRSPCSLLGGPPPSSKSESQTRGQVVGPCGNQKSGGFDMLQPMVERKNQWVHDAHKQRSPQSVRETETSWASSLHLAE